VAGGQRGLDLGAHARPAPVMIQVCLGGHGIQESAD
jgi:hypothetical protein